MVEHSYFYSRKHPIMFKFLYILPLLFLIYQPDAQLLGRWKIIDTQENPTADKIEILFMANHSCEFFKNDKSAKGNWRVIQGKNDLLLSIQFEHEEKEDISSLRFIGDTLYLYNAESDALLLKIQ